MPLPHCQIYTEWIRTTTAPATIEKERRKRRPCVYNGNDDENKPILSAICVTAVAAVTVAHSHRAIVLGRGKELAEYSLGELLFSSDARAHLLHDIFCKTAIEWECLCGHAFSLEKLKSFFFKKFYLLENVTNSQNGVYAIANELSILQLGHKCCCCCRQSWISKNEILFFLLHWWRSDTLLRWKKKRLLPTQPYAHTLWHAWCFQLNGKCYIHKQTEMRPNSQANWMNRKHFSLDDERV